MRKQFLRGHSCCSALLKLTDNRRQALKNKKDMAEVAVDLSKAFHAICHNLLLLKMKAYGVRDYASKLIQSYLSVRFKRVTGRCQTGCLSAVECRKGAF